MSTLLQFENVRWLTRDRSKNDWSKAKRHKLMRKIFLVHSSAAKRCSFFKCLFHFKAEVVLNLQRCKKQNDSPSPYCIMLTQQPVIQFTAWWRVQLLTLSLLNMANINHTTVWDTLSDSVMWAVDCWYVHWEQQLFLMFCLGREGQWCALNTDCGSKALTAILAPNVW